MASIAAYLLMALSGVAGGATLYFSLQGGGTRPCPKCKKEMMADWTQCLFCKAVPDFEEGKPALLHFINGPLADQVATLEKAVVAIGSVPGNDIVISDPSVSRKHVGIRKADGGYEIADLGSTNGVFVNGDRVPKKRLALGDVIRVGNIEMIFRL